MQDGTDEVSICTDSQALLRAIQCGSPSAASIISQLNRCSSSVVLQWIPAHSGITGNTLSQIWRQDQRHITWMSHINLCLYEVRYLLYLVSSVSHPGLMLGLQRSMEIMMRHGMKEQYRIEETQFGWLKSAQDIAMHSEHITI